MPRWTELASDSHMIEPNRERRRVASVQGDVMPELALAERFMEPMPRAMATDPQSGRVLKVDVTVNVVKRGTS